MSVTTINPRPLLVVMKGFENRELLIGTGVVGASGMVESFTMVAVTGFIPG